MGDFCCNGLYHTIGMKSLFDYVNGWEVCLLSSTMNHLVGETKMQVSVVILRTGSLVSKLQNPYWTDLLVALWTWIWE